MIRAAGQLRPPVLWAPAPQPEHVQIDEALAYYLFGLWHYVCFSFGARSLNVGGQPVMQVEVDTEYLVTNRGARVVRRGCLSPEEELGPPILEALGVHERPDPVAGRASYDLAADQWQRDPEQWTKYAWKIAHETLVPELTLGDKEALDFLHALDATELGNVDILLKGPLALTELAVRFEDFTLG
jgi:hypothetical protein